MFEYTIYDQFGTYRAGYKIQPFYIPDEHKKYDYQTLNDLQVSFSTRHIIFLN